MSTLAADIRLFLSLHHRAEGLSAEERAEYEGLRERVQHALQQPVVPSPAPERPSTEER